ncbi:MAG: CDP-diacylglycerol--glycerol-3-phosphate 3-phosphatidyltransferase [Clostridia bacterium]|nr:CDP-diacylglycerol--glycerol-3-phosphate 3-phosphatidyltransferase [Clostridia bacterium]
MNLPNRLSLMRVFLVPVMVALCYWPAVYGWAPGAVFTVAALTDLFDGWIARRRGQVTDFGKFLDPLADKLLVLTAMVMLVSRSQLPAWVLCIVIARELAVDGLRMIAVGKGQVIAASWFGKIKTVCQMVMIHFLFYLRWSVSAEYPFAVLLCTAAVLMTIWSGVDYFMQNSGVIRGENSASGARKG